MAYKTSTIRRAEQILGYGIQDGTGEREYPVIDGVVYTDVFTGEATVEGYTGKITRAFNGKINGLGFYNQLYVNKCKHSTVKVTAAWGSADLMAELKTLLDHLDTVDIVESLDGVATKSLRIKDYSETFATAEEQTDSLNTVLYREYGYYIRRPLIVSIGSTTDAARYF